MMVLSRSLETLDNAHKTTHTVQVSPSDADKRASRQLMSLSQLTPQITVQCLLDTPAIPSLRHPWCLELVPMQSIFARILCAHERSLLTKVTTHCSTECPYTLAKVTIRQMHYRGLSKALTLSLMPSLFAHPRCLQFCGKCDW